MRKKDRSGIIIVRGAGDLATGTIHRLCRAGYPVLALETAYPMAIRRKAAFSEAVVDGEMVVEGIRAVRVENTAEAEKIWIEEWRRNEASGSGPRRYFPGHDGESPLVRVPVLVDPEGHCIEELTPSAVVDAILAKRNLGTHRGMAPLTIALGPGFTAGEDVDFVIETMRGHDLGRIICEGQAAPNTGVPGLIAGYGSERVIHAPASGILQAVRAIGDTVERGETIAVIKGGSEFADPGSGEVQVRAKIGGLLRGLIRTGTPVTRGLKIADVDPRTDQFKNCFTISDKARCIAGSVLEIVSAFV